MAPALLTQLNYGTTLAGLVAHGHKIDYDDWHASVHGSLPYEQYLKVGGWVGGGSMFTVGAEGGNAGWQRWQPALRAVPRGEHSSTPSLEKAGGRGAGGSLGAVPQVGRCLGECVLPDD